MMTFVMMILGAVLVTILLVPFVGPKILILLFVAGILMVGGAVWRVIKRSKQAIGISEMRKRREATPLYREAMDCAEAFLTLCEPVSRENQVDVHGTYLDDPVTYKFWNPEESILRELQGAEQKGARRRLDEQTTVLLQLAFPEADEETMEKLQAEQQKLLAVFDRLAAFA